MTPKRADAVVGIIALSVHLRSNKLMLADGELELIQGLSAAELADVETACRLKSMAWLNGAKLVRELVHDGRRNVA